MSFENEIEKMLQSLLETFKLAQQFGDEECNDPQIYLSLVEELCTLKQKYKHTHAAIESAAKETTVEDFDRTYQKILSQKKKYNPKTSLDYKTFQKNLQNLCQTETDDVVMVTETLLYLDPLSKKLIQNPVKNKKCGHRYEKSTILEAVQINKQMRCPVAGCLADNFLRIDDLEDDEQFRKMLTQL